MTSTRKLYDALMVIAFNKTVTKELSEFDPQALKQIVEALDYTSKRYPLLHSPQTVATVVHTPMYKAYCKLFKSS